MEPSSETAKRLETMIEQRFGAHIDVPEQCAGIDELTRMLQHCSHRKWKEQPLDAALLRLLCACALAAPSKSDLQQTDIVIVADRGKRRAIVDQIDDMEWIMDAPAFMVFCGNNRRLRLISQWRGKPFPNDHLDQFFNAACDAAIIMASFLRAAEAVGLGCCPISHVRNNAARVSEILELPEWVFPFAGLCAGYPERGNRITPRLPLEVTVHTDRYDESRARELIDTYDQRRHQVQPYGKQRDVKRFGEVDFYGWSEDKARQYGVTERENFGAFVRTKGFGLD
jgi:nitroreductase/FMN reductase [NAD(P)H]